VRRRVAALAALGLAAYVVFLVAMLPARVVTSRLALPPGLSLEAVEGTAWNGAARVAWRQGGAGVVLDRVQWRLQPLALLSGRVAYAIDAEARGLQGHARVARSLGAWSVEDLELQGDAASVATAIPLASAWQPTGRISASAARLAWDGTSLTGSARATWTDASLALAAVRPLGSYALTLEGAGGPARIAVTTTQGPLRIVGDGTVDALGRVAFTGEARAEGPQAAALAPLLDLLGPRRSDGSRALRFAS
jgi:general secretion pathway protein N